VAPASADLVNDIYAKNFNNVIYKDAEGHLLFPKSVFPGNGVSFIVGYEMFRMARKKSHDSS